VLLSELLTPECIRVPLVASSKDDLLSELVGVLGETVQVADLDDVLRAVREREQVLSTGIGNGVAIPHGKSGALGSLAMAAGVTRQPTEFEALDGQPVRLLFLLVGPESAAGQHVKALSRVSRLLRRDSFRQRLIDAGSAEEFFEIIREAELT
jgi:mannitol/fructose-specific phosphotransferase system IIA component (Ntr-type)